MSVSTLDYTIEHQAVTSGFDGTYFWGQARGGVIPGDPPIGIITTQRTLRSGSDVYYAIAEYRSDDGGATWQGPVEHTQTLGRRFEPSGWEVAICDMTPKYHAASGKMLATGHTVRYVDDKAPPADRAREVAWAVYDRDSRTWTPWDVVTVPNEPRLEAQGAGSTQRVDLEDGTILLPVYGKPRSNDKQACHDAAVLRCAFDGERLSYIEHGNLLTVADPRGCCEPSLTRHQGRYYLTIRNDVRGYVAVSDDGLHFGEPRPWRFDDGEELGNYNTQQHWATHSDGLFLVYTRKGLDNDHVFRHRAPLVMAQVDPERLCVLRETEREVVPNRGARLGNFGVCNVTPEETWIVAAEWMQPVGCEQYGSDNTIWLSRLRWDQPNALA